MEVKLSEDQLIEIIGTYLKAKRTVPEGYNITNLNFVNGTQRSLVSDVNIVMKKGE